MKNLLKSKKFIAALAILMCIAVIIPLTVSAARTVIDMTPIGVPGTLKLEGSTTVGPIVDLAKTDYNTYRGSTFLTTANIIQKGSDYGKQGAILHLTDIGMTSSTLSTTGGSGDPATNFQATTGSTAASQANVLTTYPVARDGLVFIVNDTVTDLSGTGNNITSIDAEQLYGIYTGHITNWNQITDPVTGITGKDMTIVPRARVLSSGTRASWSDSIKNTAPTGTDAANGLKLTSDGGSPAVTDWDPATAITNTSDSNYYTENNTIVKTGLPRGTGNVDIQGYINQSGATGQCGYVGLGMEIGTHIKALKIYNKAKNIAYAPTGLNIYTSPTGSTTPYYPFGRFIFLCLPKYNETSFSTPFSTTGLTAFTPMSDITNFITWMQQTDGKGQDNVQGEGFLRLIPDQDVTMDNAVDVSDLVAVGNKVGQSGAAVARPASRADVTRDGTVDVSDLVAVGNWVGANIIPSN